MLAIGSGFSWRLSVLCTKIILGFDSSLRITVSVQTNEMFIATLFVRALSRAIDIAALTKRPVDTRGLSRTLIPFASIPRIPGPSDPGPHSIYPVR